MRLLTWTGYRSTDYLKREELLHEGNDLDKKIQKRERELEAIKRTLDHIQSMNSEYRISVSNADTSVLRRTWPANNYNSNGYKSSNRSTCDNPSFSTLYWIHVV